MQKAIFAILFFLGSVFTSFAQDTTNTPPTWSGSYSMDLKDRYFGSTICASFADQTVLQEELDLTRNFGKTSVTGIVWNSDGFSRGFGTNAYETDMGVSVARQVGKVTLHGNALMFFLNPTAGFNVEVFDLGASRVIVHGKNTVEPFVKVQIYHLTNNVAIHGGVYPMIGVGYARKLSQRLSFVSGFHENYDVRGGFGFAKRSHLFYAETGLRIALTDSFSVTLPRISYGGSYDDPGRPGKVAWGFGIAKTF